MITVEQAAEALGLTEPTLKKYARENVVPAFKVGRKWRFESLETLQHALALRGNKLQQAILKGRSL